MKIGMARFSQKKIDLEVFTEEYLVTIIVYLRQILGKFKKTFLFELHHLRHSILFFLFFF